MNTLEKILFLRNKFGALKLNPDDVLKTGPINHERQLGLFQNLWRWVDTYRNLGSREKLEERGMIFPPIYPGIDPECDWTTFERWVTLQPLTFKIDEAFVPKRFRADWSAADYKSELKKTLAFIDSYNLVLEFSNKIPAELVYEAFEKMHSHAEFEFIPEGSTNHIDLCDNYNCENCFQKKWCDLKDDFDDF